MKHFRTLTVAVVASAPAAIAVASNTLHPPMLSERAVYEALEAPRYGVGCVDWHGDEYAARRQGLLIARADLSHRQGNVAVRAETTVERSSSRGTQVTRQATVASAAIVRDTVVVREGLARLAGQEKYCVVVEAGAVTDLIDAQR